jgi:MFS family permease
VLTASGGWLTRVADRVLPPTHNARVLVLATIANTVGNGMYMTGGVLFLIRSVGLSAHEVGIGMTVAAIVGVLASAPMGHLADRWDARTMQIWFLLLEAALAASLALVHSVVTFLVVAVCTAVADAGWRGSRGALIAGAVPADNRVRTRALLRSSTNVGVAVGAALAGLVLADDTRIAYLGLVLGNAVTFLVTAAITSRMRPVPKVPAPTTGPRLIVLRDRSFLTCIVLDGFMSVHYGLLNIALPLWISFATDAPRWIISAVFVVNTAMVILFQVRVSRGTERPADAARASRRAGLLIGAACVLFALAAHKPAWLAVALLLVGALVHVFGELRQAAAAWGISFGLAPEHAQGQYQGAYAMGQQLGQTVAPITLTTLVLGGQTLGWLAAGVGFTLVGLLVPVTVGWAIRTRPEQPVPTGP